MSLWAQSPDTNSSIQLVPRTKAQREQTYEAEHRISLIVQVTDSSGRPVSGLKAEDFSVLDNQKVWMVTRLRSGACDHPGSRAELVVIEVLNFIQVAFNADAVDALHFGVVQCGHGDASHWTQIGPPADLNVIVLHS